MTYEQQDLAFDTVSSDTSSLQRNAHTSSKSYVSTRIKILLHSLFEILEQIPDRARLRLRMTVDIIRMTTDINVSPMLNEA